MIDFVIVTTNNLDTQIEGAYLLEAWHDMEFTNCSHEHVRVQSQEDMEAYIQATNDWLMAAWTPNQSDEEKEENAKIMKESEREMKRLKLRAY